jgi:hypothetical protein
VKSKSLVGQRFGRLVAVERFRSRLTHYRCICDCGKECTVRYTSLKGKHASSCGCYKLEVLHRRKQPDDVIRANDMLRYYKRNAKLRGVAWAIDKEIFIFLITSPCEYCGYTADWCGIDRVRNSKGYIVSNCVPCCRWCNWGKNERTVAEFDDWVRRLYAKRVLHRR